MSRPDRRWRGPEPASLGDIEGLNRVFSDAFTDRYARDGMVGVRVPHLNPLVWRYAIEDAGEGAMVWRDLAGEVAAFNMVHRSGLEGWMGPLCVRPDLQGEGLGTAMVEAGLAWLRGRGARIIGLETMPRTVDNIGFYSRLGLVPAHLTITLVQDVRRPVGEAFARLGAGAVAAGLAECHALTQAVAPGVDFTRELELTLALGLGDACLVRDGATLAGWCLWHVAPLAAGRPRDELRLLKLVARDEAVFARVMRAAHDAAVAERVRRIAVRCQTAYTGAYRHLVAEGYRVHWTDLRMTLAGHGEVTTASGVVLSNWEI